jgi:hypothetical protein
MASQILSNAKLYAAGFNFSGDVNALALKYSADMKDATTLIDTTRQRRAGLKDVSFQHEGFWNGGVGNVDDAIFNSILAVNDVPMTIGPLTGAEGELAYSFKANPASYAPGAKIGEMFGFSVSGSGDGPLARGTLLTNSARTVTGTGTIFNLGAVSSVQSLIGALHFYALAGAGTLIVKIQSAALVGFGSPTDRITFATLGAVGGQFSTLAGPVTDAFWRASWTISGFSSCTFAVNAAIQ